ncbi:DUF563 domain-containing protein [Aurantimonas sp. VKM B-3413]|uniref:glycosyltransferase family 61 protein n=1 Tax=Aurantimonas sp. VKM B-3413 TaxID=2779401 RepID=UPI001E2F3339|nr:glycosyltransferase 61 family protein [Aurantimonas sp. VKM B-3413]MCB8839392.1 glycosyltransferase family 61 protein [Aurantimonas sp. VKM B-3413]
MIDDMPGGDSGPLLFNDVCLLPDPFFDRAAPLSRFPAEFKMTPAVTRTGERLTVAADPGAVLSIEEPVIALASTEARNYGSWLFRILPKLLTLDQLGPEAEGRSLLLPMEAPWMEEIIAALAPGRRIIAQDITRIAHLPDVIAPSLVAPSNIFPKDTRKRLLSLASSLVPKRPPSIGRRLYVSRRNWSETIPRRVLLNETDVVMALRPLGFQEIFPERLTFVERVAAFACADIIVGPTGSGLFNTVFCHPGTVVLELEPHTGFRAMHAHLYQTLGLFHAFLRGTVTGPGTGPAHPNWQIDSHKVTETAAACVRALQL